MDQWSDEAQMAGRQPTGGGAEKMPRGGEAASPLDGSMLALWR
jgi:hypothetical protein